MNRCILVFKRLSNHMYFTTNGDKRFSKTNSSDPRQRVLLNQVWSEFRVRGCLTKHSQHFAIEQLIESGVKFFTGPGLVTCLVCAFDGHSW